MRKCFLIFLFLVSFSLTGLSQQSIDSLRKVLLVVKDTQRVNTLISLGVTIMYGDQTKPYLDTAANLLLEALTLSKKLYFGKGVGNALLNLGIINTWTKKEDFHYTLSSLQTALPLLKQAGDPYSVAPCYGAIADSYHHLGENNSAILFYDSCIHLFQQSGDTVASVWKMIDKGHSYFDLGNFNLAYKTLHDALELTPKKDTLLQCFGYCHTAKLFLGAGLPEIVIEYMNTVKAFYPELRKDLRWPVGWVSEIGAEAFLQLKQTDSAFKIAGLLNIPLEEQDTDDNLFYGHLYLAMRQPEKALIYFKQGYKLSQHASHEISLARHANELAVTYLTLKNFPEAIHYAKEAILISEKIHALVEQKNAIGTLSNVYAATKNYSTAYHYNELYNSLNDSLAPEEYKRKLSLIQVKDQLEMQKKEAQLLSNQNQISQQQIKIKESSLKRNSMLLYIFIAALTVTIVLVFLINRNIKLKRKKIQLQQLMEQVNAQQKLTELEKEKSDLEMQALRAQMNPHFIFNCLSSINRFILINKTDEASSYLIKFSRLIRMALQNSEKPLITLESELEALRLYLDLERLRFKNTFNYSVTFINTIDPATVYIPPMLIQPFVENAIWHGLMQKKGTGYLDIQLCMEEKTVTCVITDNGIGRNSAAALKSKSAEKSKSMGVDITAGRLALLSNSKNETAVFNIEDLVDEEGNGCGTKVVLRMPCKSLTEVA